MALFARVAVRAGVCRWSCLSRVLSRVAQSVAHQRLSTSCQEMYNKNLIRIENASVDVINVATHKRSPIAET